MHHDSAADAGTNASPAVTGDAGHMADDLPLKLPPKRLLKREWRPMLVGDARFVIGEYNRWIEVWNRRQLDGLRGEEAPWSLGGLVMAPSLPRSALLLSLKSAALPIGCTGLEVVGDEHRVRAVFRIRDWEPWMGDGLWGRRDWCRNPINLDDIVWAGWALNPRNGSFDAARLEAERKATDAAMASLKAPDSFLDTVGVSDDEAAAQDAACDIEPDQPEPDDVPGCFAELGNRGIPGLDKKVPRHLRSRRARQAPPRKRKWSRL